MRIDVVSRLAGEALCPVRLGVAHAALVPFERPVGEGRVWTTATPVVLPGYDHRRGRARPQRSVRGLLRHAVVGEALVEAVTREPGARLAGSAHAVMEAALAHVVSNKAEAVFARRVLSHTRQHDAWPCRQRRRTSCTDDRLTRH